MKEGVVFASSVAVCQDFSLLAWRILAVVTTAVAPVMYRDVQAQLLALPKNLAT